MFRNTPLSGTSTYQLMLGFGLCTLGGAMLYVYFKNRDDDEVDSGNKAKEISQKKTEKKSQKQQKEVTIELAVDNAHIPLIVGRGGGNLSLIEEKTQTKIRFRDKNKSQKVCAITGFPDAVKEARVLLLKEVERAPIVRDEIYVPQGVCGKIMGRCGEAMQEICRTSLAKVAIDSGTENSDKRRIIITGNRQQVNIARKLIGDKVAEDEQLRLSVDDVEQRREPRRSPTNSLNSSMYSSQTSLSSHLSPREKLLAARSNEKPTVEVYVSAVASPSKFWVQLIGPQTRSLDDMVQSMTAYYRLPASCELHQITEPYLGQIVAAVFKYDGKWYRAEIVGILPNQFNRKDVVLDLYFVDYGDSEYVSPHEVFELRTDFLTLRFQAVECFLANVMPTIESERETWESQSIQKFEELTQVANWKKLISRVVSYKERPKTGTNVMTSAQRESSPIPGVELYDLNEGVEVNIGQMLISQGYALPTNNARPRSPFASSSPESSMYQPHHSLSIEPQSPALSHSFESIPSTTVENEEIPLKGSLNSTSASSLTNGGSKTTSDFLKSSLKTSEIASHGKHNHNGNLSR